MQKGIIFLAVFAVFAIDVVLLVRLGAKANDFTFWIVLITLPLVGWIAGKVDFRSGD